MGDKVMEIATAKRLVRKAAAQLGIDLTQVPAKIRRDLLATALRPGPGRHRRAAVFTVAKVIREELSLSAS